MNQSFPTRAFREHTDLNQLKRQAKELLNAFRKREAPATDEVNAHYRGADAANFGLHDAQLVLARAYGFPSWPKLKAYVDGVTAKQLVDAVRAGDREKVQTMLRARPELVNMDMGEDERRAIHYAVLSRSSEMTRLLMRHGADARKGVYPHREATSALILASDRGYDEILAIIGEEEERRRKTEARASESATPERLLSAEVWESGRALDILRADPTLARSANPEGWAPLHAAAYLLDKKGIEWLLDHGADPNGRAKGRWTPLDMASSRKGWDESGNRAQFETVARLLLERGAELGLPGAVALGDVDQVRARHGSSALVNPTSGDDLVGGGGLLTIAVWHDQPAMLTLLLDLGLDPNERVRLAGMDEIIYSAGGPLFCCVAQGKRAMAEMLLDRGADPNADVYTSGSPLYCAYKKQDWEFVKLLERHGGLLDAVSAGWACQTEAVRKLLADEAAGRLRPGATGPGKTVAEDVIWSAAGGGDPEIVRMALEGIDWPREDSRWLYPLWQAFTSDGGIERGLACFRLILNRADPNQGDRGRTILHTVMARGEKKHLPFAEMLLDHGARLDIRDELLESTALGWACRWGRVHFVQLLLGRGADPVERDAKPWATPEAWARRRKHDSVLRVLLKHRPN